MNTALIQFLGAVGIILYACAIPASAQRQWIQSARLATKLKCVTYGNNLWVAGAINGNVMTSPDGINWTPRSTPTSEIILSITFANNLFVAIVNGFSFPFMTSSDGINWNLQRIKDPSGKATSTSAKYAIAYGNGVYLSVGTYLNSVNRSYDGINWVTVNGPNDVMGYPGNGYGLVHKNGYFYASHGGGKISRSLNNGATWAIVAASGNVSDTLGGIASSPERLVAVGADNTFTSADDGANWTIAGNPTTNSYTAYFTDVAYGDGDFVAVDLNGDTYSAKDGINWKFEGNHASGDTFEAVAFAEGKFVAVGDYIATSAPAAGGDGPGTTPPTPPVPPVTPEPPAPPVTPAPPADGSGTGGAPEISIKVVSGRSLFDNGTYVMPATKQGKKSSIKVISVTNEGLGPLTVNWPTISGQGRKNFKLGILFNRKPPQILNPGEVFYFDVQFRPRTKGVSKAVIQVESSTISSTLFQINLKGTGK